MRSDMVVVEGDQLKCNQLWKLTRSILTAKQFFSLDLLRFSSSFENFLDLSMIAMPNSRLVLDKETLKQHFER